MLRLLFTRTTKHNKGYSLLEVILALAIVSMLIGAFFNLIISTSNMDTDLSGKTTALRIGTGLVQVGNYYIQLIADKCGLQTGNTIWGWSNCASVAFPYPYVDANLNLVYIIPPSSSALSANDINSLKSYIRSVFAVCNYSEPNTTTINLNCNSSGFSLFKIEYRTISNTLLNATTVNNTTFYTTVDGMKYLDYSKMPSVILLHFDIAGTTIQYRESNALSFYNDFVLNERSNETFIRYTTVLRTLRSYASNRFFTEVSSNSTGLKSVASLNVPWAWQVLATTNFTRKCNLSGNVCDYNTNEWIGPIATNADVTIWQRIMTNLGLESRYSLDGFGNPAHLIPLTAPCRIANPTGNIINCNINNVYSVANNLPSIPNKNYVYNSLNDIKPPFSAAIINRACTVSTTIPSNLCIMVDVYPN